MSAANLLMRYRAGRSAIPTFGNATISIAAGANGTIVAAPGAGLKLIILEGEITAAGAGTWSPYHTAVNASNLLSATAATTNNKQTRVGPWELPENQPFVVAAATQAIAGWCLYAIVSVA